MMLNPVLETVTERIKERSLDTRRQYLARMANAAQAGPARGHLSCSNLAHGMAACASQDKNRLTDELVPNIAIVTAYNDMLSAHAPYERYPALIKETAERLGAVAQVAGGVPAMCDGVTQGQPGMDLSLFSRDVIAMSTAVALSHNMFDAALCLGVCDKIVPGMLMGALSFGHLPMLFVPAGPMPSGLPNKEKAAVREAYASGQATKSDLIAAESAAYHSPGTCTFYGTANSNQMLLEFMGLQLPGSSFVNPDDPARDAFTRASVETVLSNIQDGQRYTPLGEMVSEEAIVNAVVGLLATGGSTNHTLHLVAIAKAAGISLDWGDMATLSTVIPLMTSVYPNGSADVNHFESAGGLAVVITELLEHGLLHPTVRTCVGEVMADFGRRATLAEGAISWPEERPTSSDHTIIRPVANPFQAEGGISVVKGDIGRAVVKVSAVAEEHRTIDAPARVFQSQDEFAEAFEAGELNEDMVVVLPGQGPKAMGMPELHRLTPYLGVMQNKGLKVALLTDGRMSGASGKVLAAIQVTPEAADGGLIQKIQSGDRIVIDSEQGELRVHAALSERSEPLKPGHGEDVGMGRELFQVFRDRVSSADAGASVVL